MRYWVYIARMKNGRLYVGHTNNMTRRPEDHHRGDGSRTTRISGFEKIIYTESHENRLPAVKRERQLKGLSRAKKLALASGNIATLKSLARSHPHGSSKSEAP